MYMLNHHIVYSNSTLKSIELCSIGDEIFTIELLGFTETFCGIP